MLHRFRPIPRFSIVRFAAAVLVLGAAATGCTQPTTEPLGTQKQEIVSGTPDDSDGAAVLVVGETGSATGYCSGVIVSPHVVLTAAHCAHLDAKYSIFLGADYNDATAKADPGNYVAVAGHHPHPKFDAASFDNDVGVLVTAAPIPRAPATMNRRPFVGDGELGKSVRIVGFGETVGNSKVFGRRTEATTKLAGYDSTAFVMVGAPNFCLFDSGGPTFMVRGGAEVIVGIHMSVDLPTCDGKGVDMRVDPYIEFVDSFVATADPPADAGNPAADAGSIADAGSVSRDAGPAAEPPREAGACTIYRSGAPFGSPAAGALLAGIAMLGRRARRGDGSENAAAPHEIDDVDVTLEDGPDRVHDNRALDAQLPPCSEGLAAHRMGQLKIAPREPQGPLNRLLEHEAPAGAA
jgi:hypothetical protein